MQDLQIGVKTLFLELLTRFCWLQLINLEWYFNTAAV